jgi:cell division transport system ATP-binding protein
MTVSFEHVTKTFGTGISALDDISFTIEPGEFVVLTGESGAGKTTIMRLLLREMHPTEGDVHFDGRNIRKLRSRQLHSLRRMISVVFQDYKLLPEMTVYENVSLPLEIKQKEIKERVLDVFELVGLTGKEQYFPSQLSGGEAQRVGIARALVVGPKVIFADEPTGNLDPKTGDSIIDLLVKINGFGPTVLLSTHNLDYAKRDNVRHIQLQKGRLVSDEKKKSTAEVPAESKKAVPVQSIIVRKPDVEPEKKTEEKTVKAEKSEKNEKLVKPQEHLKEKRTNSQEKKTSEEQDVPQKKKYMVETVE